MNLSRPLLPPEHCPVCGCGYLHLQATNLIQVYGDTAVRIPNAPVWACDICRYQEADPVAERRVRALVEAVSLPAKRHLPVKMRLRI